MDYSIFTKNIMKTNSNFITNKNSIIEDFNNNLFAKDISVKYNIPKSTLIQNLNRLGYNFNREISRRLYTLNMNFFEKIDTEEKAYWLGLIYADGSNKVSSNVFVLGLTKKDSYILEILKKSLNYNGTIKIQKDKRLVRKDFYRLEINCKKMSHDLLAHGVFQNKTFILKGPDLTDNLIPHFIRGYFDGDGGIYTTINKLSYKKDKAAFTGTKEIMDYIDIYLKKLNIHSHREQRFPERKNNNYTITINGRLNLIKFFDKIYDNKAEYFFTRKYERFLKIKNRYE